jgi:phosphatidylserine/phosphatidylglycerophosphate/cardiolipin synthase-like enzyme
MGDDLFGTPMDGGRSKTGGDLFIVDNSDDEWKAQRYLSDWADVAHSIDIATGYFEIGALLSIDGQWQKLDKIRILMGDEVSRRTRRALLDGMKEALDDSVEREKEKNDFLTGAPAIIAALQSRQIEARVYTKAKFHAKAYITHAKAAVIGSSALVGSSNFTLPGLTTNVELNVQLRREVVTLPPKTSPGPMLVDRELRHVGRGIVDEQEESQAGADHRQAEGGGGGPGTGAEGAGGVPEAGRDRADLLPLA